MQIFSYLPHGSQSSTMRCVIFYYLHFVPERKVQVVCESLTRLMVFTRI